MILLVCNLEEVGCYQRMAKLRSEKFETITNGADFQSLIKDTDLSHVKTCIIQVGLNWEGKYRMAQYGFTLVTKLRYAGLKSVIYFHSLAPLPDQADLNRHYPWLLASSFHRFLPTPLTQEALLQLPSQQMSDDLYDDICETLLEARDIVREFIHDLKNKVILPADATLKEAKEILPPIIDLFFEQIQPIVKKTAAHLNPLKETLYMLLFKAIEEQGAGHTVQVVEQFTHELIALAPEVEWVKEENELQPYGPWKVLFVDDEESVRRRFAKAFERNHIRYEMASTPQEALVILEEDRKANRITVLVSDIRFKDPQTNEWGDLQGYDLLREVHLNNQNLIAKFAITAARKRLRKLKNNFHFQVYAYYKDDIQNSIGAMNIFCQKIREEGEYVYFKSRSLPKLSSWIKGNPKRFSRSLADFYKVHLFSPDYKEEEERIGQEAYEMVEQLLAGETIRENMNFIGTIRSELPTDVEGQQKFQDRILLGRRIALALYCKGKTEDEIFYMMQPKAEATDLSASKKLLFNTSLSISFKKDFPDEKKAAKGYYLTSNLLEEEIRWLRDQFKVEFDLKKIQLSTEELGNIKSLLDDLQSGLRSQLADSQYFEKMLDGFRQEDVEKVNNRKKIASLLKTSQELYAHFNLQSRFKKVLEEEINDGYINDIELKDLIKSLL